MMPPWLNLPDDTSPYFGFIYIIKNNHPDLPADAKQYYIGKKQLLKRIKRKPLKGKTRNRIDFVDNNVQRYWGSSKELQEEIAKWGIEHFSRQVLEMTTSKWHAAYAELQWQLKYGVLLDPRSFNGIVNVRIGKAPASYRAHMVNMSKGVPAQSPDPIPEIP